jgi:uncharacterized protein YbaR (Trm112 family)
MVNSEQRSDRKGDCGGATPDTLPTALEPWVVSLLACPVDRSGVRLDGSELVCTRCDRRYPVQNGIPNMLPDEVKSEH